LNVVHGQKTGVRYTNAVTFHLSSYVRFHNDRHVLPA
jgi:hypothetical protein